MTARGGAYSVNDAGELQEVEPPTHDHPDGNRPRDASGAPLDGGSRLAGELPSAPEKPKPPRRTPHAAAAAGD
jgi:hypothetical protein